MSRARVAALAAAIAMLVPAAAVATAAPAEALTYSGTCTITYRLVTNGIDTATASRCGTGVRQFRIAASCGLIGLTARSGWFDRLSSYSSASISCWWLRSAWVERR